MDGWMIDWCLILGCCNFKSHVCENELNTNYSLCWLSLFCHLSLQYSIVQKDMHQKRATLQSFSYVHKKLIVFIIKMMFLV